MIAKAISANDIHIGGVVTGPTLNDVGASGRALIFSDINSLNFTLVNNSRFSAGEWLQDQVEQTASDISEPSATGSDALVRYVGITNRRHSIHGIAWGYNDTPVGSSGQILIQSPSGTTLFDEYVTSKGPGFFNFEKPFKGAVSQDLLVYLKSGGVGVKGTMNVIGHQIM